MQEFVSRVVRVRSPRHAYIGKRADNAHSQNSRQLLVCLGLLTHLEKSFPQITNHDPWQVKEHATIKDRQKKSDNPSIHSSIDPCFYRWISMYHMQNRYAFQISWKHCFLPTLQSERCRKWSASWWTSDAPGGIAREYPPRETYVHATAFGWTHNRPISVPYKISPL